MVDSSAGGSDSDSPRKPLRRRASRPAGPVVGSSAGGAETPVVTTVASVESPAATPVIRAVRPVAPPARRRPNQGKLALVAGAAAFVVVVVLATLVLVLTHQHRQADQLATRDQRFVDTATQTVVNMFTYTPDTVDDSVNQFVDGISGPLRDMMSQNNNVENLKSLFRDTNATSEAVVSGAALEEVDPDTDNGSVLVAVRVTVTDIDGVNKPSQAYRMRVIVHEDDNGRMTGYDLKYPDGGN
ncbi:mammalian cell entry protein [soil metagenome]